MNKVYNSLNTLGIVTTGIVLTLCCLVRMDMLSLMSVYHYVGIFTLAATIFSLPDFLCYYFPSKNKWYSNSEFYTCLLLVFLGVGGLLLGKYAVWIGYIIVPAGIALAFWELDRFIRHKNFLTLVAGAALTTFIALLVYSNGNQSLLLPEKIVLGKAHIDTLFSSSISNMFATLGWSSTGLDGSPYYNYHWGSHALFGGLKNWVNLNTLMFYSVAYPAIFIPLFFKTLCSFINRFFAYKGSNTFHVLLAIAFITVMYSLSAKGFQGGHPIASESFCVALIFTFLYASNLLSFASVSGKFSKLFIGYSVIMLLLISLFKISTGFVCCVGMGYLSVRTYRNVKPLLMIFIGGIIIAILTYIFVFPVARTTISFSLAQRVYSLWIESDGFITYLLGALIAMLVVLKHKPLKRWGEWKSIISSREYIDLEILFVITMSGFAGAIAVSSNASDAYYFCLTQFYLSMPYLIFFGQRHFERFRATNTVKAVFLFSVTVLSVVSRPDVFKVKDGFLEIIPLKAEMLSLTPQQQLLKDLVIDLYKLEKGSNKETKCIYIPQTEKWFYESQTRYPMSSPMVAPAISGIALIGGISEDILKSDYNYYSFYYYKKTGSQAINSLEDAKDSARKKGYKVLIAYRNLDSKLVKQTFAL